MKIGRTACGVVVLIAFSAAEAAQPIPRVLLVQPSGAQVPANLLRISIHFEAPPQSTVLSRISLSNTDGTKIRAPFLAQELWSPDGKTLTFLLHPGRVKQGLEARAAMGPILEVGQAIVLTLDERPIKLWKVASAVEMGPVPQEWKVLAPRAATRQPLIVALNSPIDGVDGDYLAVARPDGHRMPGRTRLSIGEREWRFTPSSVWPEGRYQLRVRGTLEDAAGNRLGGRFEAPAESPAGPASSVTIPFATRLSITPSRATRLDPLQDSAGHFPEYSVHLTGDHDEPTR